MHGWPKTIGHQVCVYTIYTPFIILLRGVGIEQGKFGQACHHQYGIFVWLHTGRHTDLIKTDQHIKNTGTYIQYASMS